MENARVRLIIEGRVQGVWFRDSTRREASRLGVKGWIRNRPEGSVELVVEGPEREVRELVRWCHHGPPGAGVKQVSETPEQWRGEFKSFEIAF